MQALHSTVTDREEPPKSDSTGAPPLWDRGVANPLKSSPSLYVLLRQIL